MRPGLAAEIRIRRPPSLVIGDAGGRRGGPAVVAVEEFVAPWQSLVLDQQPADVVLRLLSSGCLVERFMGDHAGGCQRSQGLLDVGLFDPGDTAVRAGHRLEGRGQWRELVGDRASCGAGEQIVDEGAQRAAPATALGMELGFGAADTTSRRRRGWPTSSSRPTSSATSTASTRSTGPGCPPRTDLASLSATADPAVPVSARPEAAP